MWRGQGGQKTEGPSFAGGITGSRTRTRSAAPGRCDYAWRRCSRKGVGGETEGATTHPTADETGGQVASQIPVATREGHGQVGNGTGAATSTTAGTPAGFA